MGSSKTSALIGGALFLLPGAHALAADIPSIPPPVAIGGAWYLRGDIGMTNQSVGSLFNVLDATTTTLTTVSKVFDSSPLIGFGIGYKYSDHVRFDVTGEYRSGASFHGLQIYTAPAPAVSPGTDEYTGVKTEWTFLANAYWDIGTWKGLTPFVGAGIGASYNTISGFTDVNTPALGVAYGATASTMNLAWALYAGLGYQVTPNLTIEAAYRYIDLGNAQSGDLVPFTGPNAVNNPEEFHHLTSQDIKVGFRWAFGGGSSSSYYPPVVKY